MAGFRRTRTTEAGASEIVYDADMPDRDGFTSVGQWPEVARAEKAPSGPTSSLFAGVCRYYHDCFAADSRGGTLTNILDKNQAEYLIFSDGTELLATGQIDRQDVPLSTGVTAQNAADVNRREKFLIYGSFFLVGRGPTVGRTRKGELYCAPLLYWPARIEHEGSQAWLTVDLDEQRINFPLLASLIDAENDEQAQAYAEAILDQVPSAPFGTDALAEFKAVLEQLVPDLKVDDLDAFPDLQDEEALRALLESPVQLMCASAMALIRRPQEARGVLTELQSMGQTGELSNPLAAIFTDAAKAKPRAKADVKVDVNTSLSTRVRTPSPQATSDARSLLSGAELSAAQEQVVRRSEYRPLTLVIGPPGTGKSFTIAQLILDAVARGQTVLLSSKMNKAVDVVVEKLQPHLGNLTIILRGGDRRYRDDLKKFLDNLFDGTGAPTKPRPGEIEMVEDRLRAADEELSALDQQIATHLATETHWTQTNAALAHAKAPAYDDEAAQATGYVEIQRAAAELRRLAARKAPVTGWLAGRKREQLAAELAVQLGVKDSDVDGLERIAARERLRAEVAEDERALSNGEEINALLTRHARVRADRGVLVGELLALRRRDALAEALRLNRRTLSLFKTALEARSTAEQDRIFAELDFSALLHTFPIWATTNPHVAEMLPLDHEMFDLVIIDEASQCDVASGLPLLFRAKRAVVCGDPKQLRHLSFLREDRQAALASQHGLSASQRSQWNYRTHSLLDVVNGALPSQDDVVLLDEHYRSLPQIIEFSNHRFYGDALRVMTRRPDTIGLRSVELRKVNGKRVKQGYNAEEAEAILAEINKIAKNEIKQTRKSSIGVLSPYRDQVNYLNHLLATKLKTKIIEDHNIAVGTAHTFQGDERDLMLLSFCADPTSHRSTVTFMNNDNLFNVAVTRARARQVVFSGLTPQNLPPDHLLAGYLDYAANCLEADEPEELRGGTHFEREVATALRTRGARGEYRVFLGYPVAGFKVDVVAQRGNQALAIACDGDPDIKHIARPDEITLDTVSGQAILERAGWRVHRVSYRRWHEDREACLSEIDALLGGGGEDE